MSVYPRGDRSRGQFFVDEEVLNFLIDSERLASSCRCRAHGTLVVPAIVARRTPRLMTSLRNYVLLVDKEGYPLMILPVLTVSTLPYQVYGQTDVRTTEPLEVIDPR